MNLSRLCVSLMIALMAISGSAYAQRYAVAGGNWDGAIWASAPGGAAGSASVPTSSDDIVIGAAIHVTVNSSTAECRSVSFTDSLGAFDLAEGSVLSVYGNFTIVAPGQKAFTTWPAGAKLRFAGTASQVLSGWSTTSYAADSTILMEVVVDKTGDTLKTPGTDMKIGIGTSLQVLHGNFFLGYRDDIDGRDFSGGAAAPTIEVDTGASFKMSGSLSSIRSGASGKDPIGKMTIKGYVSLATTSSVGIAVNDVDITASGELHMDSFSSAQPGNVKLDTITVEPLGQVWNSSTIAFWDSTTACVLNTGGIYKVTTATTNFPKYFVNNGTVRYQRTAGDGSQTITDMDYHRLEISFTGTKTWTLGDNHIVADSLEINNSVTFVLASVDPLTLTVNGTLRLTTGTLNNSNANVTLAVATGAQISRATGTITNPPVFGTAVDVRYTSVSSSVTTGPELPAAAGVLRDLQIICDSMTVTLNAAATVNGTLTLSNGTLNNNGATLTLANGAIIRRATAVLTAAPVFAGSIDLYYISTLSSVSTGHELPSGPAALHSLTIICDTNTVVLSAPATVVSTLTLSAGTLNNSGAQLTLTNGAWIRRARAVLTSAPVFAGSINVAYISTVGYVASGLELPASTTTLRNLLIQTSRNVGLSADVVVNDSLQLQRGYLYLGSANLLLAPGAVIGGAPTDTSMVVTSGTGVVRRILSTGTGTYVFPVGDTTGSAVYAPVTLTLNSGSVTPGSSSIGVRTTTGLHPAVSGGVDYLGRYWSVVPAGLSAYSVDAAFQYDPTDVHGAERRLVLNRWNGASWSPVPNSVDTVNHFLHAAALSDIAGDFTGLPTAGSYTMVNGWNLISIPFEGSMLLKNTLFPTSVSKAFAYNQNYVIRDTLLQGVGYWLKFGALEVIPMTGAPIGRDTFVITRSGWALIGSIGYPVPVTKITPVGLSINSRYFDYSGGYHSADTIKPGKGYWVKVSGPGQLILDAAAAMTKGSAARPVDPAAGTGSLTFEDARGNRQVLYVGTPSGTTDMSFFELPPQFQAGSGGTFDARFASGRQVETPGDGTVTGIAIAGAAWPVKISWKFNDAVNAALQIGGGTVSLSGTGTTVVQDASTRLSLRGVSSAPAVPADFVLAQNFPNPFNPSTTIRFGLPAQSHVLVEVFDVLGRRVQTLMDGVAGEGYHAIEWHPVLGSGVYFYTMTAVSTADESVRTVLMNKCTIVK